MLHSRFGPKPWFNSLLGYLAFRYHPLEDRILDTLRYVDLHPKNKATFSYEFGGIIRDIGSTFSSVLDNLVRKATMKSQAEYNITDYIEFLINNTADIELIGAQLSMPFNLNLVLPFDRIKDKKIVPRDRLTWWNPYNNLKHSEIGNYQDGCLSNVVYGMASLAVLYTLMFPKGSKRRAEGRLFYRIGYFTPIDEAKKWLFPV